MLRLDQVRKGYGAHEVLAGVDWAVPPRARVGLVGRNGSGKTTLLRLISGEEEPDAGKVERPRGTTFGYLAQEGARLPEGSVLHAVLSGFPDVAALEAELESLHEAMVTAEGAELESLTRRAGQAQLRFEAAGGFRLETEARRVLTGLGLPPADHARPLRELSGGYRMRAALAALLVKRPDYLLLDEPTNHLDLEAVGWLESYLAEIESALILVSHDRAFLNRLAGSIADLSRGRVIVYAGNYDRYRVEKEAARDRALAAAAQEAHRVADVERFIERFRYKATKARQVQSRIKMLEKMKRTDVAPEEKTWRFLLPPAPRSGARVLRMAGLSKGFDGRPVLRGIDLELRRGDRVALVGANGSGKSTLLKIAAGALGADEGVCEPGEKVVSHYFAQHVLESLTVGRTVLEEMQAWSVSRTPGELRSLLGIFQFSGEEVFKRVEVLSGGEKSRLALARLMLDPGNFLILDEPTNHLDLPAREALEQALARYDGSLLFVSHDRYFIDKVATRVAGLEGGRLQVVEGGYEAWSSRQGAGAEAPPPDPAPAAGPGAAAAPPVRKSKEQRRAEAESRNERGRLLRALRERVASLESAIQKDAARLAEIEARLADPATYRTEGLARSLGEEKKALQEEIAYRERDWEETAAELEQADRLEPAG